MKINVFLQARMSSTRLPGKVLMPLIGKPMIYRQIERIRLSKLINEIIILTSTDSSDNEIVEYCELIGCKVFRGDLNNVLSRYIDALKIYSCDHVVRLTGDCPLIDWEVIDATINKHLNTNADYTSNVLPPTFPDGLDVEVIAKKCLQDIGLRAKKEYEKEHVTYFCYQNPDRYHIENYKNINGDESSLRWTVDHKEDFDFVNAIYEKLYFDKPFRNDEIRQLLKLEPSLINLNQGILRNEGLLKSLESE
ncbi:MAG: glycosyltransferase family protein [Bermanella sp.]